jgi:3-hydroxyacyl-[acyl-carrier-protein] dehydratase
MRKPVLYDQIASRDKIVWKISRMETDSAFTARGVVPVESAWFDGHFPGTPILPGVAQLAMVVDILKETLGRTVTVACISRVRFKSAIRPGDVVTVEIKPKTGTPLTYVFQIFCCGVPASGGGLTIAG